MKVLEQIVENIPTLVISLIVAYFASKVALKGFYRQEIWLRREKQYTDILVKLCNLLKCYNDDFEYEILGDYTKEKRKNGELREKIIRDIETLSYSPSYLIDDKINNELRELVKISNESYNTTFDHIDSMCAAVKDAIKIINEYAKKELKIR